MPGFGMTEAEEKAAWIDACAEILAGFMVFVLPNILLLFVIVCIIIVVK